MSSDNHTSDPRPPSRSQIIRLKAVMAYTGMGRSWIYREMKAGRFVGSIKIGRATGWDASAVEAWVQARIAAAQK